MQTQYYKCNHKVRPITEKWLKVVNNKAVFTLVLVTMIISDGDFHMAMLMTNDDG